MLLISFPTIHSSSGPRDASAAPATGAARLLWPIQMIQRGDSMVNNGISCNGIYGIYNLMWHLGVSQDLGVECFATHQMFFFLVTEVLNHEVPR